MHECVVQGIKILKLRLAGDRVTFASEARITLHSMYCIVN